MSQKRWIVTSRKFILFCVLLFTAEVIQSKGVCEVPCRTYRDGSNTSLTRDGSSSGGGGGATSDTIALSDAPFGVTKVLRQCDFTPSYTIKCSGTYVFGEPIKFQGTAENACALIIAADDVTVNLNGYSLTYEICGKLKTNLDFVGDDGSTKITYGRNNNVHGICFCPPRKNITIRNGAIRLFTGYGIRGIGMSVGGEVLYKAGKNFASLIDDDQVGSIENVTVNEITANNNKVGIAFMAGDTTTTIKSATAADNFIASDVRILYSTTNFNDDTGIIFNTVTSSEIIGSTANNNGGNTSGGQGLKPAGFDMQNSRKLTIKENCAILNKVLIGSLNSYGIYLHKNNGGANKVTDSLKPGTYETTLPKVIFPYTASESYYVIESIVEENRSQLNNWGFRDDLSPSSTIYMTNRSVNNGASTLNGSGNYYIYFSTGNNNDTDNLGHGELATFTKVASLAVLNTLNAAGKVDNISIGTAGSSQRVLSPSANSGIVTPRT
jgi:hypothetical protein